MYSTANLSDVELKEQGNRLFSTKKFDDAIGCYTKAIVSVLVRDGKVIGPIVTCKNAKKKKNQINDFNFDMFLYDSMWIAQCKPD